MEVNRVDQAASIPSADVVASLVQARSITSRAEEYAPVADKFAWLRCLAGASHNSALKYWRENNTPGALELGELSCKWGQEVLDLRNDLTPEESVMIGPEITKLEEQLPTRWELVCACHHRLSDQPVSRRRELTIADPRPLSVPAFELSLLNRRRLSTVLAHWPPVSLSNRSLREPRHSTRSCNDSSLFSVGIQIQLDQLSKRFSRIGGQRPPLRSPLSGQSAREFSRS